MFTGAYWTVTEQRPGLDPLFCICMWLAVNVGNGSAVLYLECITWGRGGCLAVHLSIC